MDPFLAMVVIVMGVIVLAFVAVTGVALPRIRRFHGGGAVRGAARDAEELALISGGPRRVAECAIAALVDGGALRVDRAGRLTRTGHSRPLSSVEAAVMAAVANHGRHVAEVIRTVAAGSAVTAVTARMVERGDLSQRDAQRLARRRKHIRAVADPGASSPDARRLQGDPAMFAGAAGLVAVGGLAAFPDDRAEGLTERESDHSGGSVPGSGYGGSGSGDSGGHSCGGGSGGGSSCGGGGGCGGGA